MNNISRCIVILLGGQVLSSCASNVECKDMAIYDSADHKYSEIYNLSNQTVYIVPWSEHIDSSASSEVGGSLLVGRSGDVAWFDWPLGFALSNRDGRFEAPLVACFTKRSPSRQSETLCRSKKDGRPWLWYTADEHGVLSYRRYIEDHRELMKRRNLCSLSYEKMVAMELD
jgi:hypothetical protein